jgi:hypothetical protein
MRITYRTLAALIEMMSEDQIDSDVTVEIGVEGECYAAELRICDGEHDSLDDDHPVIYIPHDQIPVLEDETYGSKLGKEQPTNERRDDVTQIAKDIGLVDSRKYNLFCVHCGKQCRRDEHGTIIDYREGDVCGHGGGNEPHEAE